MKKIVFVFCFLLPNLLFGQFVIEGEYLNVNNVNALINPVGNQFYDFESENTFEVPANSGTHTIFNSALWIAGKDANNQLKIAAEKHRGTGNDFFPGPLVTSGADIATITDSVAHSWNRLWRMKISDIDDFIVRYHNPDYPNYEIPQSILDWPANGDLELMQAEVLAPYEDVNEDGFYNPEDGDYPIIRGDECLFFIFNDKANIHTETGGASIGIEVHGMAYGFNCESSQAFNNTIFFNYKIINRSTFTLYNFYTGVYTDFDIGNASDDYIGCDVLRGLYYGYNGDEIDESIDGTLGYESNLPAQATMLLGGVRIDPDGIDNPNSIVYNGIVPSVNCDLGYPYNGNINGLNFEDEVIDNERYGMTRFSYFNNSGGGANNNTLDPQSAYHYYNYMDGYWLEGTPICYGGTGHYSGGANVDITAKFVFPGDPSTDPCGWGQLGVPQESWSEETEGNAPQDRRGVGVSGPMTYYPGQELELDIAYIFAQSEDGNSFSSIDLMKSFADTIKWAYINNMTPCGRTFVYNSIHENEIPEEVSYSVYPNPANDYITIEGAGLETTYVEIIDIQGRRVFEQTSSDSHNIDVRTLNEGVYFIRVSNGRTTKTSKLIILR